MWPVLQMAFQPAIDALDSAGPAARSARSARYEGSHMNPHDALARLVGR
jgi:hypothetical protein